MDYYCEVCDMFTKPKSKYKHCKSESHKEFDKCKHNILSLKDIDINNVDEAFYFSFIEHNKNYDYFLVKCHFKIVFNNYE